MVTGRLHTRSYAVDGQRRSATELEAYALGPDLARCTADVSRTQHQSSAPTPQSAPTSQNAPTSQSAVDGPEPGGVETAAGSVDEEAVIGCAAGPTAPAGSPARVVVGVG